MLYATYEKTLEAIGSEELAVLTDRENTGAPVRAVAERALEDASRFIDGYLTHKYQLPLVHAPDVLRRIAIDIAVYYLAGSHSALTDDIRARYEGAEKFLDKVSKGQIGLGLAEPAASTPDGADGSDNVLFDGPDDLIMTRDSLKGM
ncbi:gp436 family protein [Roseibium sp.]|uniref:gp436 family protein n=1 Tax=Roseibium sp. TaxID=1936156 RepID=UPI003D105CFB